MNEALFGTKRFGIGHIVGTGIVVFGTIGIAKWLIHRHHEMLDAEKARLRELTAAAKASLPTVRGYY